MAYQRKTEDEWHIEQCVDGTWELVDCQATWKAAAESLRSYRQNQPEYMVRTIRRRIRKDRYEQGAANA